MPLKFSRRFSFRRREESEKRTTQVLDASYTDPSELRERLEDLFPDKDYEIRMVRDNYVLTTPKALTPEQMASLSDDIRKPYRSASVAGVLRAETLSRTGESVKSGQAHMSGETNASKEAYTSEEKRADS